MSSFQDISNKFRDAGANSTSRIRVALFNETQTLLNDFKARSPVDSGFYKDNWQIVQPRFNSRSTIASYTIRNTTPYAEYMEYGAEIGGHPWYYKGKGSKKLAVRNGLVWAGGLNPGHSRSVQGAIGPVLVDNNRRLNKLMNTVADAIVGSF